MLTKNGAILGCKREKVMQSLSCYFCYYTRHINLVRGIKHIIIIIEIPLVLCKTLGLICCIICCMYLLIMGDILTWRLRKKFMLF